MASLGLSRDRDAGEAMDVDANAVAVIDRYLADLAGTLPGRAPLDADVVKELREDLLDATASLLGTTPDAVSAARAAINEFGEVETIGAAFQPELAMRRARRLGRALLASGPLVGLCWLAAVFLADPAPATAWRWLPLIVAPVLVIGAPATAITVATTGQLTRWISPPPVVCSASAALAVGTAVLGDLLLLLGSAVLLVAAAPAPLPLLVVPMAASLARLFFVTRVARGLLAPRRSPPLPV